MKKIAIALVACVALAAPSIAATAPSKVVYLECNFGDPINWRITLDEAAKTAAYEQQEFSAVRPASFMADKVTFTIEGTGTPMSISRVDLTITRGGTDKGKCKVITPPKRAF